MRKIFWFVATFLLMAFFLPPALYAQERTIKGTVLSADNKSPLAGVNVTVKNTVNTTQTDAAGNFEISASTGQTLQFSYVGFALQEITVGEGSMIWVSLSQQEETLNDVVVVGYATQKRANLTGAVSTVYVSKTMQSRPVTDAGRALQGAVPGLTIRTTTGELGTNPQIRLRGITGSLNASGGAQPLILVDNVEIGSLLMVNPDDIESISVLKDAASTSIYGSRAAWGVVLITTKSGKKNARSELTYSNNFSWSTATSMPKMAGSDGAAYALLAAKRTSPSATSFGTVGMTFTEESIKKMREWEQKYGGQDLGPEMVLGRDFDTIGAKAYFYRPWDAGKMYMREWAPQRNHNLGFSGGNEKTAYNLSLGYMDQEGVLKEKTDKFQRYNATFSVNSSVTNWLDINSKVLLSKSQAKTPFSYGGTTFDPLYYLYRWHSVYPYGTYKGKPFRNIVTEIQQANMIDYNSNYARASVGGTFKIVKGLTFDANYTYQYTNTHIQDVGGSVTGWNFWNGVNPVGGAFPDIWKNEKYTSAIYDRVSYYSGWNEIHTVKAFGTYNKDIQEHAFKVIGGMDVDLYKGWNQSSTRQGLIDQNQGELSLATGNMSVGGGHDHWATKGFFGRINYSFRNKLLLELNGRYDGSSFFPTTDQWEFFKSASAGYIITEERFMDFAKPYLSSLKLRGSWGSIGNTDVGSATFRPSMDIIASNWWIGSTNLNTATNPGLVPPILKWETVSTLDFGADARYFNNKVGITFDWYRRTISDMITGGVTLPSSFGASTPKRNYGEMQTTGWELAIDVNHSFSNGFNLNGSVALSDFNEKITKYDGKNVNGFYEGKVLGEIWGYETDRFFTKDDFQQDASGNLLTDAAGKYILNDKIPSQSKHEASWFFYGPGDVKYKDLNGDGLIYTGTNTLDDHGDLKVIGNSTPRYQYGIRLGGDWKGFDFNVFVQGVGKRDLWASSMMFIPGFNPSDAMYSHQMDYWTPDNPNAFYPRPSNTGQSNNTQNFLVQTKYLLDMSYLRLKNVSFGYTLSKQLTEKLHLKRLRFYFNGENLFEIDHLKIPIDPEVDFKTPGSPAATFGRVYPYRRTLSVGLQATL